MTITGFLDRFNYYILNPIIILGFALAFVYIIYSVVRFLSKDAADKDRIESRNAIFWGIFGLFIMFSVYGLIRLVLGTFGIDNVTRDACLYLDGC
jgi:hypothetical protein